MPETRHGDWTTEWERIDAKAWERPGHPRVLVYWHRVLRGADARGRTERLTVARAKPGQAGPWTWAHRGPELETRGSGGAGVAKLHAFGGGYGTTQAAKRAADRYFRELLERERAASACGTAGHPAWPHDCSVTERVRRRYE